MPTIRCDVHDAQCHAVNDRDCVVSLHLFMFIGFAQTAVKNEKSWKRIQSTSIVLCFDSVYYVHVAVLCFYSPPSPENS